MKFFNLFQKENTQTERHPMDFLPPEIGFERSYWYDERWEVMANEDNDDPNSHAVPTLCLWCGNIVPAYPGARANCHECGRSVEESYADWVYRAEFSDGCYYTMMVDGRSSSGGPHHAPHRSFVKDQAVLEMVNPLLPKENCVELLSFFRACYKNDREPGKPDPKNPIWNIVDSMPSRELPHKRVEWVDIGRNEPFTKEILTAPMYQFLSECKSRRIGFLENSGLYKSFGDAWNRSPDSNWMANILGDVYRKEVFGDRKMLAAMVECCELVLEDVKNPLIKSLLVRGIMPTLRGYIHNQVTVEIEGDHEIHSHRSIDPVLGYQFSDEDRTTLYAYARTMYFCRDGLGGLNEGNSEQRAVGAIEDAIQESLSSNYQPNVGIVIAHICNNFYGSRSPKKDRLRKCAEILRKHFPAEFVAKMMTEYKLRGEE